MDAMNATTQDAPNVGAAANDTAPPGEVVVTIQMPRYKPDLYELIRFKRIHVIQMAAQQAKSRMPEDELLQRLRVLFVFLHNIDMTPELKKVTYIDKGMDVIMDRTRFPYFPEEFVEKAKNLKEFWEKDNWGANETVGEEPADEETQADGGAAGNKGRTAPAPAREVKERTTIMYRPVRQHPIYGENGIMHHILICRGQTLSYTLDDTVPKVSAAVFGHNGIQVGTCWPLQIAALRDGAHGARIGGIHGRVDEGAYSVVVSGMYNDLDRDEGNVIHYSGSGSHENEDQQEAKITNATKSLQASVHSGKVIRVLRSSSGHSRYAPSAGLRYDGLYQAKACLQSTNGKGGVYLQFRLERCANQPPIDRNRPTRRERELFQMVREGY
ncbi:MAG: hypothetical protein M1816_002963 [Peltula sp. TS41687]|nr:MAG: hypothetical protein M1816_002963 [Peltula sp. TS41687]